MNHTYLTQEGHDRLKAEMDEMKTNGRQEVSRAIAEARDKGDLSENAEYAAAKEAQGMLELRINELEKVMATARILSEDDMDTTEVRLLTSVTIRNRKSGKEDTYKLVSESEADLKTKRISASSPIGKGLLGKKPGQFASITTPAGLVEFEVLKIFI